ncbi:replication-relaxation family protein [Patescibacteria group bacterium]
MGINKKLTAKQIAILILLYRFRFLNRLQIQQFLKHKHSSRVNTWLKYLTENNYLGRIYYREFGKNTIPAVYFLKSKSAGVLKEEKGVNKPLLNRIYREHLRSDKFITHCLFLADIYFHLDRLCQKSKAELHFFNRTDLAEYNYLPEPLPDLYFVINETKEITKRYFLEMYGQKTPRYALRHRIFRFFNYYFSNVWEKTTAHPFPTILLVCSDKYMQGYLNKFIQETMEEEDNYEINFFTTTVGKIRKEGVGKDVWAAVS